MISHVRPHGFATLASLLLLVGATFAQPGWAAGPTTPRKMSDYGGQLVAVQIQPIPVPAVDFVPDRDPRILDIIDIGTLTGFPIPKPFDFIEENDTVDAVVFLKNQGKVAATNVTVTLTPVNVPGLSVQTGAVFLAQVDPGASAPTVFRLTTAGTPVAFYDFTLTITYDGGTETETVHIPVWGLDIFTLDVATGHIDGQVRTPFSTDVVSFTAPEILDGQGLPSYFDLQDLSVQRTLNSPYNGVHWGDAVEDPLVAPGGLRVAPQGSSLTPVAAGAGETFSLHGRVHTKEGAPIPGAKVSVTCPPNGTYSGTSDANGQYWIEGIPAGNCTRHVDPPPALRHLYRASWSEPFPFTPGTWTDGWTYPDPPPGSGGGTSGGNGGGSGVKSGVAGGMIGGGTLILNLLAAPETMGAALASGFASGLIGGGSAVGADPVDSDIFIAGEDNTPPASSDETTFGEDVTMTFSLTQPPVGSQNFEITSSFNYNRFTDFSTYSWASGETLSVPIYLDVRNPSGTWTADGLVAQASVVKPDGTLLKGGEPTVMAYLGELDGFTVLGSALLRDDGQGADAAANDGVFSALIRTSRPAGVSLGVFFWAARTGFEDADNPPLMGSAQLALP